MGKDCWYFCLVVANLGQLQEPGHSVFLWIGPHYHMAWSTPLVWWVYTVPTKAGNSLIFVSRMSALLAPINWASALWTCSGEDNTGDMGNVPANPSRVGTWTYFWVGSTPGQHRHLCRLSHLGWGGHKGIESIPLAKLCREQHPPLKGTPFPNLHWHTPALAQCLALFWLKTLFWLFWTTILMCSYWSPWFFLRCGLRLESSLYPWKIPF